MTPGTGVKAVIVGVQLTSSISFSASKDCGGTGTFNGPEDGSVGS